jgi:hypothetical protein
MAMKIKEVDVFLKMVSEGLKAISQGVEAFARKIDEVSSRPSAPAAPPEPVEKTRAPRKNARVVKPKVEKKVARKVKTAVGAKKESPPRKRGRTDTAAESVLALILEAPGGLDTEALTARTGFNEKKIHNIVYKLKKQGKIKTARKGVYSAS